MLITIADPVETIRWFELKDQQHEILCVLLAADPKHRAVLKELIRGFVDADVALGRRVGFLVVGSSDTIKQVAAGGRAIYLPGELVEVAPVRPLRRLVGNPEDWQHDAAAERLARSTVSAVEGWLNLLGISRRDLPCLCALIKGTEPVLVSLRQPFDTEAALKVFGQLADIAQREIRPAAQEARRIAEVLKAAEEAGKTCGEVKDGLVQLLEAVCNRFKASAAERQAVVQFLGAERFNEEDLEALFLQLSFSATPEFARSSTVRGVRNKIKQIEKARDRFYGLLPTDADAAALRSTLLTYEARRDETRALVADLNSQGLVTKEASVTRERMFKGIKGAADIAGLVGKLGKLLAWAKAFDLSKALS